MKTDIAAIWLLIATGGCGAVSSNVGKDATTDTSTTDTKPAADAPPPACDLSKPFGPLTQVPGIHASNANDVHPTLTGDELTMYFGSDRTQQVFHVFQATRPTKTSAFTAPVQLGDTFIAAGDSNPSVTPDGNTIYFDSGFVIYTSTRSNAAVVFPTPAPIAATAQEANFAPSVTADGSAIYVENLNNGVVARIDKMATGFSDRQTVPVGSGDSVTSPATSDDLTLFFSIGEMIGADIQVTTRASKNVAYPQALEVAELVDPDAATAAVSWVSADGCRLYMNKASSAAGSFSIIYSTQRGQ